jgi:hypothetical protein
VDNKIEQLKILAENDNAKAQYELGLAYYKGAGVDYNLSTAIDLWQKSADKNYAPAIHDLASLYNLGHGLPQDQKKAVKLYVLSALMEFSPSQNDCYAQGLGVKQDLDVALIWYKKAMQGGDEEAIRKISAINKRRNKPD